MTANDGERGEQFLREFQDNEKTIPTILTTSQKLSTGVDARNVRNIVLMRPINSMIEFKQIIGRGTRLYDGKDYFTIYDFVKAHHHFNDPEWDGEPIRAGTQRTKTATAPDPARSRSAPTASTQEENQSETCGREGASHPAHDGDDILEPGRKTNVSRGILADALWQTPRLFPKRRGAAQAVERSADP